MADKRISELNPLGSADLDAASDVLAVADLSATETKKITPTALIVGSVGVVPDGTIPGSKIEVDSLPGDRLLENSVTSRELAPNSVDTIHVIDGAITNSKLAGEISGDKLQDGAIGSLQLGADSVDGGVHIKARSITADRIVQNSLTAEEISPNAIGASELGDNAVDTPAVATDALATRHYQSASVTNEKLADGIDGGKLIDGSVPGSKIESGSIDGDAINDVPLDKLPDAPANTVLAGANGAGSGPASFRPLVDADLPAATTAKRGGASVPLSGGLVVDAAGAVGIGNSVSPGTNPVITYNGHGLVTSSRALTGDDLPSGNGSEVGGVRPGNGLSVRSDGTLDVIPATQTSIGGVIQSDGITIAADGRISQSLTGVVAGAYTKVTVDVMGNVLSGAALELDDLPDIDGSQISIDNIDGDAIADRSIRRVKFADYAISFIQEDPPPIDPDSVHIGCLWFSESTSRLAMWNGNSWYPIGIGRIQMENLRYCGVFNADTGLITGVTKYGTEAGLAENNPIPTATDDLTGVYLVCETPGSNIDVTVGVDYSAGDWCLCNGELGGWVKIAVLAGGGGGGAQRLDDLLDVTITNGTEDDILQLAADGKWKNVKELSAGTY